MSASAYDPRRDDIAVPPVAIRPFVPADQTVARALILAGLAEHFGFADETANPDLDDLAGSYLSPGHLFLVAECAGQLVGTAGLLLGPDGNGQVVRVSVDPAWRRQGIARAMLAQLVQAARDRGLQRLWVETNDDWIDAQRLYLAMGFHETARHDGSAYFARSLEPATTARSLRNDG